MSVFSVSRSRCPASPLTAARKWTARQVFLQSCPPLWTSDDVLEVRGRAGEQQCDHDGSGGGISGSFVKGERERHSDQAPIVDNQFVDNRSWNLRFPYRKYPCISICLQEIRKGLGSSFMSPHCLLPIGFHYTKIHRFSYYGTCRLFGDLGVQNSWPPSHDIDLVPQRTRFLK